MATQWNYDHILHIGGESAMPTDPSNDPISWRKRIEPWLSAVFQAEHLSVLFGSGLTTAIADYAGKTVTSMGPISFGCADDDKVNAHADKLAADMGRGSANFEDQLSSAMALLSGLLVLQDPRAYAWKQAIDKVLRSFIIDILKGESEILSSFDTVADAGKPSPREVLVSFLMSFASRAASRERLHVFTTNYDRLIEKACDSAGLRIIDRFVGALEPEFRSSRQYVDMHYTPPGIRGEPRHLEGVVHLTKLHGSLDWRYDKPRLYRVGLPFAADPNHPAVPGSPQTSLIIYPNAVKDVETAAYPYADLFRDFSSSVCQANNVLVTYGYGFGDDHINRVISDMLSIPSTHLVLIAWSVAPHERIASFISKVGRPQQLTMLVGKHFGDIKNLVEYYLPKPAIDPLTIRMSELVERRGTLTTPPAEPKSQT